LKAFSLFSIIAAASLLAGDGTADIPITAETVQTFYKSFPRLTKEPRSVPSFTAVLCISPVPALIKKEMAAADPHVDARVHLYVNPPAQDVIARHLKVFPAGAIVIKEKLADDGSVCGVGGMVKRTKGFDPGNGDWEYFYSDKTAGFSTGRLQSCAACHRSAQASDYVFSVWSLTD
jgi:hypothetical protein